MSYEQEDKETAVIDGTVSYRERMALPPRCVLHVQLLDVSRQDAPAKLMGEQRYETAGKQVPLPFSIAYQPDEIDPRFTYSVSGRIFDPQGELIYMSDTITPVLTRDNPSTDIRVALVHVRR